jgi:hypothetical protein
MKFTGCCEGRRNISVDVAYFGEMEKAELQLDWPAHADAKPMHQTRQQGGLDEAATSRYHKALEVRYDLDDGSDAVVGRVKVASSNQVICPSADFISGNDGRLQQGTLRASRRSRSL